MRSWTVLKEFAGGIILVALAGFLQNTNLLNIGGVKPNIALAVLVTLAFFISTASVFLVLVVLALIALWFEPVVTLELIIFALLALGAFFLSQRLPGKSFVNNLILIGLLTLVFYLIADYRFIVGDPLTVLGEMVYNIILGGVLFAFLTRLYAP